MDKAEKYRRSAMMNFTPEELAQARTNFEQSAKRFPEEHKRTAALIEQKGLAVSAFSDQIGSRICIMWATSTFATGRPPMTG
ncbi:hypothetical protein J2X50_003862 [Aminobacter sp. BE322]